MTKLKYNIRWDDLDKQSKTDEWSWGRISWDRNSAFSWDRINHHEIEICIVLAIESYNNMLQFRTGGWHIDQEVDTQN
jgi:hypothetical protein